MYQFKNFQALFFVVVFLCFTPQMFAKDWNVEIETDIGYRQDNLKLLTSDVENPLIREKYRELKSPQISLLAKFIYKNFLVQAHGDYAWVQKGKLADTNFIGFDPILAVDFFSKRIKGDLADIDGSVGYSFTLIDRDKKLILIPLVGYSTHYQKIKRRKIFPDPMVEDIPPPDGPFIAYITNPPSNLKRLWYGPLVGGDLVFKYLNRFLFEAGYSYHKTKLKQKILYLQEIDIFVDPLPDPVVEFHLRLNQDFKIRSYGHEFRAKIAYFIFPSWGLSLSGRGLFFRIKEKQEPMHLLFVQELLFPPPGNTNTTDEIQQNPFIGKWSALDISLGSIFKF